MILRAFQSSETPELLQLFKDTVQHVNRKHYSSEQIEAWTSDNVGMKAWSDRQAANHTIVAEANGSITGFGELTKQGHIEMLYVHKGFQRKGVASALLQSMEKHARTSLKLKEITTDASITARPFFEKNGFQLIKAEHAIRNEVVFIQFRMCKQL